MEHFWPVLLGKLEGYKDKWEVWSYTMRFDNTSSLFF